MSVPLSRPHERHVPRSVLPHVALVQCALPPVETKWEGPVLTEVPVGVGNHLHRQQVTCSLKTVPKSDTIL
jgi:hypothetical protein